MKLSASEYETAKAWFAHAVESIMRLPSDLPAEAHPVASLEELEARSPSQARLGLGMAIADCLEFASSFSPSQIRAIDESLEAVNLPSLSTYHFRFGHEMKRVIERGTIFDEVEFHMARNAVDIMSDGDQRALLQKMIDDFEQRNVN